MIPASDPASMIAALVVVFGVAAFVWLMVAVGLRESPWACACLSVGNALLGGSFLLYGSLGITWPVHAWTSDMLSLTAFGLVRLAVPLVAERPPPLRSTLLTVLAVALLSTAFIGEPSRLAHQVLLDLVMGGLSLAASLDAFRLLRRRGLRARWSLGFAAPLIVVGLLILARPLEAWLTPGAGVAFDAATPFNIAWLWLALLMALTLNGTFAFLLLMKLVLQIQRLTQRDPLTDALNRRALSDAMEVQHSRQLRGHGYALVLLDMDRFKQLNDTLGHAAGDAALRLLVEVLKPCLREVDQLGRLGGEEFCALLPDTDIAGAAFVAERMRALLAERPFEWSGQSWPLTASFGIAESSPRDAAAAEVLRRADQALYRAKGQGRNVVQAVEREPER